MQQGGKAVRCLVVGAVLLAGAAPAAAQDWVIGGGFADFTRSNAVDTAALVLERHFRPFYSDARWAVGWGAALTAHRTGDLFFGVGLVATYAIDSRWFVEGSVMPGAFDEDLQFNDLGSTFEIRSLLGLGYRFEGGSKLSLAITHKSNASTAAVNPGVNSILLRWHLPF
jgi:hypothetical protein